METPTPNLSTFALVRQSLTDWINSGSGDECFWESWPECPTEIELTPNMIMAALNEFAQQMGTLGGQSKTPAKSEASRINGRKGGRPKGGKNKPKEFGPLPE